MADGDDAYFLTASLYIHLNPFRAGLVKTPVSYRWSSCSLYCSEKPPAAFVNPDPILDLLPGDINQKRKKYRTLLDQGKKIPSGEVLEQEDRIARLGKRIERLLPEIFRIVKQGRVTTESAGLDLWDLDRVEQEIQRIFEGYYKSRPENIRAKKYIIEQLIARGYKRKEIAEKLNMSRKTVYNLIQRRTEQRKCFRKAAHTKRT